MRSFWRNNSLSIVALALFLVVWMGGQSVGRDAGLQRRPGRAPSEEPVSYGALPHLGALR